MIAVLPCLPAMVALPNPVFPHSVPIGPSSVHLPLVGLGTWQYNSTVTEAAIVTAFSLGYRHLDTATVYENAAGVARGLARTGLFRTEYFVTSKIPGGLNRTGAAAAIDSNLHALNLSYVDLMLVHFPASMDARLAGGRPSRQATWLALEDAVRAGKARAIGVSHYCKKHMQDVLDVATIAPAINQVEFHVGMGSAGPNATDDRHFAQAHGITYQGFSPLCGPCGTRELISGDLVTSIGKKYNKTGAQVSLKWQVQQGIPVIPKSAKPAHLTENLDMFDWSLDAADFGALTQAVSPPVCGGGDKKTSGDCSIP